MRTDANGNGTRMLLWNGQVIGDLNNDDARIMARRMLALNEGDALSDTANFIVQDYGDNIYLFIWQAIKGNLKNFVPEDFVKTMIENLQCEEYRYDLGELNMEIVSTHASGPSPGVWAARNAKPAGRRFRR